MASFADDIKRFQHKVETRRMDVFLSLAAKVHRSIKEGSGVTGAPGQPVDTGFLRNSWILGITPTHADIQTNVKYAPDIEDGIRRSTGSRLRLRSSVGGFHSVKLTLSGANHLQAEALRELGP